MPRVRKPRPEKYAEYREASGWFLAAWRDFKQLSLDELAADMDTSKGFVSDLETGKRRFTADTLNKAAIALGQRAGRLIDVNPFEIDERLDQVTEIYRTLDDRDRDELARLAETLRRRAADAA